MRSFQTLLFGTKTSKLEHSLAAIQHRFVSSGWHAPLQDFWGGRVVCLFFLGSSAWDPWRVACWHDDLGEQMLTEWQTDLQGINWSAWDYEPNGSVNFTRKCKAVTQAKISSAGPWRGCWNTTYSSPRNWLWLESNTLRATVAKPSAQLCVEKYLWTHKESPRVASHRNSVPFTSIFLLLVIWKLSRFLWLPYLVAVV